MAKNEYTTGSSKKNDRLVVFAIIGLSVAIILTLAFDPINTKTGIIKQIHIQQNGDGLGSNQLSQKLLLTNGELITATGFCAFYMGENVTYQSTFLGVNTLVC